MNMNRYLLLLISGVSMVLAALTSCGVEEVSGYPAEFQLNVRFESPSGSNVIDDMGLMDSIYIWPSNTKGDGIGIIDELTLSRESDGMQAYGFENRQSQMSISRKWFNPANYLSMEGDRDRIEAGTLLEIGCSDFKIGAPPSGRPGNYDDIYTISLKSQLLFGNYTPHTIRWFVHVTDRSYTIYHCEIDGQDFDVPERSLYGIVFPILVEH